MPAGFFSLPRELRDQIYDQVPTRTAPAKVTRKWSLQLRAKVRDLPQAQLLLVSRQFSDEYMEAVAINTTLVIEDHIHSLNSKIATQFSGTVARLSLIELHCQLLNICLQDEVCSSVSGLCGCATRQNVAMHSNWVKTVIDQASSEGQGGKTQRRPRYITIIFHIPTGSLCEQDVDAYMHHVQELVGFKEVALAKLVLNEGLRDQEAEEWTYDGATEVAVVWRASEGWAKTAEHDSE